MKNCPQCHLMMESVEIDGVVVEVCRGCGGSWFEWESLADLFANHPAALGDLRARYPSAATAEAYAGIPLPCPNCRVVALAPAAAPGDPALTLPRCPRCGGAWLDAAARDGLAGPMVAPAPAAPPPVPSIPTNGAAVAAVESLVAPEPEELPEELPVEAIGPPSAESGPDLLAANLEFARTYDGAALRRDPARRMAVVTCMDVRIPVEAMLGLKPGDAHVIRNAGGVVTEDVLRSLLVSIHLLGTREVLVVAHTDCGQTAYHDEEMRAVLARKMGTATVSPAYFHTFADPAASVRQQLERILCHPWVPDYVTARGFVFDVRSGRLAEVAAPHYVNA